MPSRDEWVLIDTSAWIHAFRPDGMPAVREQVRKILAQGRAATCEMIILELLGGTKTEDEYRELQEELESLEQLSITPTIWKRASELAHALRRKGISVPAADQLIASVSLVYACGLLHRDKHFDLIGRHFKLRLSAPFRAS